MTDTQTTIIVAAIAPTLTALGALVIGVISAMKASETKAVIDANDKKTDVVIAKAEEIHSLTNGHLSKVTNALEVANKEISGLKEMVTSLVKAKEIADRMASEKGTPKEAVPATLQKP